MKKSSTTNTNGEYVKMAMKNNKIQNNKYIQIGDENT